MAPKRRRNPPLAEMLRTAAITPIIEKAKNHVIGYYSKKSKKGRRKNPDITVPSYLAETMLPASDVAEMLDGEFIPLRGMIINDDEIQLITEAGVKVTNGSKARLQNRLSNPLPPSTSRRKINTRTITEDNINTYYGIGFKAGTSNSKQYGLDFMKRNLKNRMFSPESRKAAMNAFNNGYKDGKN